MFDVIAPRVFKPLWWLVPLIAWLGTPSGVWAADALPSLIERFRPSVLPVGFFVETNSPRFGFRGSGFVVADGNLLITNAHVIERSTSTTPDGSLVVASRQADGQLAMRRAELVEVDKAHDLALLRFEGSPLPILPLLATIPTIPTIPTVPTIPTSAAPAAAREGQRVAFIGFPLGGALGFSPVTHRGSISSIAAVALPSPTARQLDDRSINRIREGSFELLQLDATAYPGNSGGPLFDADTGDLLGVVNMVALKGTRESALTNPSGIAYAIPARFVWRLIAPHVRK